ncbi:MBL fold metallo-hydrolase [Sphingobium lactosutens]|uniref:MBL fold metallo-hydrolase n=1 Tax=Sphingobium lactosutens TaxID=522773 RepID=UPI0015C0B130|nr:MBL fold metallo-hydrolase [Sphingobium lactosutens]
MKYDRRGMIGLLGVAAMMPMRLLAQDTTGATVILLGTAGGPPAHVGRSQPASLLQVGGKAYLIDAGENVGQQLARAGVVASRVDATLLTHLHWDHTLGLDYLMATGWMRGRRQPMPIWGPPGTRNLVDRTLAAIGVGEAIFRAQAQDRPPLASLYPAREVDVATSQTLFDDGIVKLSAVANTHFAEIRSAPHDYGVDKAYSYRFDTAEGAVVFTGDTGPSDGLAGFARGAALMVAEIVDLPSMRAALVAAGSKGQELDLLMQHMAHQHLTAEALGQLAAQAGVKKLALSHYVIGRDFDPTAFVAPLRKHFGGEIIVGQDLMTIQL